MPDGSPGIEPGWCSISRTKTGGRAAAVRRRARRRHADLGARSRGRCSVHVGRAVPIGGADHRAQREARDHRPSDHGGARGHGHAQGPGCSARAHPGGSGRGADGAAVLGVRHLNKGMGRSALLRGKGSIGIGGTARVVLIVGKDPEDPDCHVLARSKGNLAPPGASRRFAVVGDPKTGVGRVEWRGESRYMADDLTGPGDDEPRGAVDDAAEFLAAILGTAPSRSERSTKRRGPPTTPRTASSGLASGSGCGPSGRASAGSCPYPAPRAKPPATRAGRGPTSHEGQGGQEGQGVKASRRSSKRTWFCLRRSIGAPHPRNDPRPQGLWIGTA